MPVRVRLHFTRQLGRFLEAPMREYLADSPRTALEQVFTEEPRLRSYLLDDQGRLRQHVALFLNGRLSRDPAILDTTLVEDAEIHFMQALSGG